MGESFVHDVIAYNRLELLRLFLAYNYDLDRPAKRLPPNIHLLASSSSSNLNSSVKPQHSIITPTSSVHSETNPRTIQSPPQVNLFEKSPFQMALERGHLDMARILAEVGCFCTRLPISSTTSIASVCTNSSQSNNSETNQSTITPLLRSSHAHQLNPLTRRYNGLLEVKSLQKWCRKVIRHRLGFRLIEALPHLPIPVPLKDFLLLRDLDWSVYLTNSRSSTTVNSGELAIIVPP
ncbi:unnamed protein product [Trichobilharzia regenti]|nr:unnamed protein product [Trichobilharzia regenti]